MFDASDFAMLYTAAFAAGAVVAGLVMATRVVIKLFRRIVKGEADEERS